MSVNHAILSMLQAGPMSGYDLKKTMQASSYMPWSGNNNQVYKALAQLCGEGLLASETLHREDAPTKKVYRLTDEGRAAIRHWIQASMPEAPEIRNPFLLQLEAAAYAEPDCVPGLLAQYREQVHNEWIMQNEIKRRKVKAAEAEGSTSWVIDLIYDNMLRFYQSELDWIDAALDAAGREIHNERDKHRGNQKP